MHIGPRGTLLVLRLLFHLFQTAKWVFCVSPRTPGITLIFSILRVLGLFLLPGFVATQILVYHFSPSAHTHSPSAHTQGQEAQPNLEKKGRFLKPSDLNVGCSQCQTLLIVCYHPSNHSNLGSSFTQSMSPQI